jgi:hypothetical protein
MKKLTEVFLLKEDYNEWLNSLNINQTKSSSEFKIWLKKAIPVFVYKYMICAGAVKTCNMTSGVFAATATHNGFPTFIQSLPGHYRNITICSDSHIMVDITNIQFQVNSLSDKFDYEDNDPYGETRAVHELLSKISINPFSAIELQKLPKQEINNLQAPHDKPLDIEKQYQVMQHFMKNPRDRYFEKDLMSKPDDSILNKI